jgi:hypothetical protein
VDERYMPHIQGNKRSWKSDETLLRLHVLPAFGRRHIDAITCTPCTRWDRRTRDSVPLALPRN